MKKKIFAVLLPAMVLATIGLSSCKQDPVDPKDDTEEVKDYGQWTLDARVDSDRKSVV